MTNITMLPCSSICSKCFGKEVLHSFSKFRFLYILYVPGLSDGSSLHFFIADLSELPSPDSSLDVDLLYYLLRVSLTLSVSGNYHMQTLPHLSNCSHLVWCEYCTKLYDIHSVQVQRVVSIRDPQTQGLVKYGFPPNATCHPHHLAFH